MIGMRHSGPVSTILLLSVIFTLHLPRLEAQDQDSGTGRNVMDLPKTALQDHLGAQRWWYGWIAGYSAATTGQVIVCLSTDNLTLRQDMALGAATTLLGVAGQLISPMVPRGEAGDYPSRREYLSGSQAMSSEQAARLLKTLAMREKEGRSWKTHAIAGAVNLGSGLITWLGFKRTFMDGLENFAINTVITEAQIWTQPVRARKDYERYLREYESGDVNGLKEPESEWHVNFYPGGFSIRFEF